ncbi:P-loop containing nucleoside triphosphate hydrolase protein [Corynascus novoguineensis]|uniref:P-loop containing nucleoside triphosphate hydrolase protein n=1 Tax=Corynascus novoguineensis TaxID=1126955 RepID=A0AAN7CSF7_9PEZI|nr:P-loop containing nucleoside triphosphate hydrolase protein [Corynascus novoguineensis]
MLCSAPVRTCRYGPSRLLPNSVLSVAVLVLKSAQLIRTGSFARSYSSEHAHHEARIESVRNIGIIAHVDAGKTTTTERMLYHSGVTRHLGNVDHGNTTTDFLPMERERGITIQSAAITFQWPPRSLCPPGYEPTTINLIDTPGHQDFRYEVDRCLPILDGAVCILDSVKGVETHTERVWESAQLSKIPRLLFVNKLDRDGASFRRSVHEVTSRLRTWPLLCQIPWWHKDDFVGVIDVIHRHGLKFSSTGGMSVVSEQSIAKENPALREEMETARLRLIETLSENDDHIMEEFLELEKDVSSASIKQAIRRLIMDGEAKFTPVFAGASLRNIGVQPLLDGVIDYLPSPIDRPPLEILGAKAQNLPQLLEQKVKQKGHSQPQAPIVSLAHVFKAVDDPRRGMMSWLRVYHGAFSRSSHMWNSNVHNFEKPQNILHVSANNHHEIQHLSTGHIGAMTGLKSARTGDTLITFPRHHGTSAPEAFRNLRIKAPEIPPAVAFIAIEPYTRTAGEKLEEALKKLSREDPSIRWSKDEKTEQLILSGMGLLHLEIAQDRLLTHYKIDRESAMWGDIEVGYSECLLSPATRHRVVYDRAIRDKAGKAACTVTIEPLEAHHHDTLFESSIERDGNIIHVAIPLSPNGDDTESLPFDPELVRQQLLNGAIAGLARGPRRSAPVRHCHVHISFDPAEDFFGAASTGGHITNAALSAVRGALKEAHASGQVGILEPFTRVQIHCPEEAGTTIQHDLASARGGQVLEVRRPEDDEAQVTGNEMIDVSKVYVPPDPYESVQSLRGAKKAVVRMLTIIGKAPLKEMMKYDSQLRSMTGGRHTLQLDPGGFELVTGPREKALEERLA